MLEDTGLIYERTPGWAEGWVRVSLERDPGGPRVVVYGHNYEYRLVPTAFVLEGVTATGDLDLTRVWGTWTEVRGGLTLSAGARVLLGNESGSTYGQLRFRGTQELGGTGQVVLGGNGNNALNVRQEDRCDWDSFCLPEYKKCVKSCKSLSNSDW